MQNPVFLLYSENPRGQPMNNGAYARLAGLLKCTVLYTSPTKILEFSQKNYLFLSQKFFPMKILQNHYTFTHFVTKVRQYQWKVYSFLASLLCVPSGCAHTIARPKFKSRMQFAKQLLFGALCHRRKNWRHTKVHASLALRKIDSSVVVRELTILGD